MNKQSEEAAYSVIQSMHIVAWAATPHCTVLLERHQHILLMFVILQFHQSENLFSRKECQLPNQEIWHGAARSSDFAQCSAKDTRTEHSVPHPSWGIWFSPHCSLQKQHVCPSVHLLKFSSEKGLAHQEKAVWHQLAPLTWEYNVQLVCARMHTVYNLEIILSVMSYTQLVNGVSLNSNLKAQLP